MYVQTVESLWLWADSHRWNIYINSLPAVQGSRNVSEEGTERMEELEGEKDTVKGWLLDMVWWSHTGAHSSHNCLQDSPNIMSVKKSRTQGKGSRHLPLAEELMTVVGCGGTVTFLWGVWTLVGCQCPIGWPSMCIWTGLIRLCGI